MTCPECHHRPSGRNAEYGAECQCRCHGAADAAPDLLAALKEYLDWHDANFALPSGNFEDPDQMDLARAARRAIAKAEGHSGESP